MSRTYSAIKDKNQNKPKVDYQIYLKHPNEPRKRTSTYVPADIEAELLEDIIPMRQRFRRLTRTMKSRYA